MPQRAQTVEKLVQSDKISKDRKEALQRARVNLGIGAIPTPEIVARDEVALGKWNEIMELYRESDLEIATTADVGLLLRYCLLYSEWYVLTVARQAIQSVYIEDPVKLAEILRDLKIDNELNRKNTMLLRMDTELFLTPLSKHKALPRDPKKPKGAEDLERKGFSL